MRFVLAMAARELRASWRRLIFFFACMAIGVGAIVTLRSVIQNVREVFAGEARTLMGADLVLSSNQVMPDDLWTVVQPALDRAGATRTPTIELATMARVDRPGAAASRMVELRAVEADFPFYGTLTLEGGVTYDHALLRGFGVLVRPELLAQLGVSVGDGLVIGTRTFTIRGVVRQEPGRRMGAFSLGPRVFVDLADLRETGLLAYGSRVSYQHLVRVDEAKLEPLATTLTAATRNRFVRVRSYRAMEDDLGDDFARAENYLSLVGLVILLLGGVGVSSVTSVFVQQKVRSLAVLKCLGATARQLLAVYLLQTLLLGLAGSLLGLGLAWLAVQAVPGLVGAAAGALTVHYRVTWDAVGQGIGIGLATALLFSLVPLLDVRHVKPSRLLREDAGPRGRDPWRLVGRAVVAGGIAALAVWQAGSLRVGLLMLGGLTVVTLLLQGAAVVLIRAVAPLAHAPGFALRHAVLQIRRPAGQARLVLLTVGLGAFFILGVRTLQLNLVQALTVDLRPDAPDLFLLDVQADQVEGVRTVLGEARPDGTAPPTFLPVLRARVTGVQGRAMSLDDYEDVRGRGSLAREYTVTYRPTLERNERVVAGAFWDATPSSELEVSIEESLRLRFGLDVGDTVRFDVLGRPLTARVTSVRHVEWADTRSGGFMFVFRPGVLEKAPHGFVGFVRGPADTGARARLQTQLAAGFPNVSVIDGREVLTTLTAVTTQVSLAVTAVGTLVLLSGLLILSGAVAMTKFRRMYEAALFKTLGASRALIARVLVLEYGVLGLLAGLIGAAGALGLTWAVSRLALDIPWAPQPLVVLGGVAVTAVMVAVVGLLASWDVLQRRPMATLRAE